MTYSVKVVRGNAILDRMEDLYIYETPSVNEEEVVTCSSLEEAISIAESEEFKRVFPVGIKYLFGDSFLTVVRIEHKVSDSFWGSTCEHDKVYHPTQEDIKSFLDKIEQPVSWFFTSECVVKAYSKTALGKEVTFKVSK